MTDTDPSADALTLRQVLQEASACIGREDALHLLLHVLDKPHAWLYTHDDALMPPGQQAQFAALVARREAGEPVAYLTGERGFWTLCLQVSPATLVPRSETELLVEAALERMAGMAAPDVLDLGTGSGAVALALASERPDARVQAVDSSREALAVAAANAARLGLAVAFHAGSWFAPVAGQRFALVVSNPPYIRADDPHLAQGDVRFEPRTALVSGADGLADLRHIIGHAPAHLQPSGWLLLEHGWDQGQAVRQLLREAGFAAVATRRDVEGRERVSLGQWPGTPAARA